MFMAHMPHSEIDFIEETLKSYDIGGYLIGLEKDPYEHYHFAVEMTDKDYHNFSKRVFKDKFKLRGRATKGKCRQYGKEKNVKDVEKMLSYTAKDKNVRTNLEDSKIKDIIAKSFKKVERLEFLDECAKELETKWNNHYIELVDINEGQLPDKERPNLKTLRIMIINILRKKNLKTISRSKVESVLYRYFCICPELHDDYIYGVLYGI